MQPSRSAGGYNVLANVLFGIWQVFVLARSAGFCCLALPETLYDVLSLSHGRNRGIWRLGSKVPRRPGSGTAMGRRNSDTQRNQQRGQQH